MLVGEKAQEIIERNLRQSDAVIFLDTPRCGESEWVELELQMALSLNIPIVWIKIGPRDGRASLNVVPADKPHFYKPDIDPSTRQLDSDFVDGAIQKAFEVSRENAKKVFGHLRRVRVMADKGSIDLKELSHKYFTYQIQIPRQGFRYYQRPMTHIVRFYGRIPQDEEQQDFIRCIDDLGYESHPVLGQFYDTALMLAPIASQNKKNLQSPLLVDSIDEYISSLEHYVRLKFSKTHPKKRGVIISGAFPDCEPEYQQYITDAIHAFTKEILDREGIVIFGAHPTFQYLIFDIAKQRKPKVFKHAVRMYVSKYFITDATVLMVSIKSA